jgi:hypothetical protein
MILATIDGVFTARKENEGGDPYTVAPPSLSLCLFTLCIASTYLPLVEPDQKIAKKPGILPSSLFHGIQYKILLWSHITRKAAQSQF